MKKLILLLNMGGPNNLDEVEVFLKNMFNDPCILGIKNKFLRKIVAFLIVKGRVKIAKSNYSKIGGKSPICGITKALCDKISSFLGERYDVDFAMNYTPPFVSDTLQKYKEAEEIIVFPLYPHYSVTTVRSSLDDFESARTKLNLRAKIKVIDPFYENSFYNENIALDIKSKTEKLDTSDITLIFSAHSLPQKIIDNGDRYEADVKAHVEILKKRLVESGLKFKNIRLAYQSRLGRMKWLEPSLNEVLGGLEIKKALIYPISFCVDNSETVFELCEEYKIIAHSLGYEFYDVVSCPNDKDWFARFIIKSATE